MLDAGTGAHSLSWISQLPTDKWTAVTASEQMAAEVRKARGVRWRPQDGVAIGNWEDDSFLQGEQFDVIIADYLIGAVEGFAPYTQDLIMPRLRRHLKPGGKIYVIGLEPIPERAAGDADLICEVRRVRDAMILLAGHRCYREFPLTWMERHLEQAGYTVDEATRFPILYSKYSIVRQLNVGRSKLDIIRKKHGAMLSGALGASCDALEEKIASVFQGATADGQPVRLRLGFDYVIQCSPAEPLEGQVDSGAQEGGGALPPSAPPRV